MSEFKKICLVHKRSLYQKYILEEERQDLQNLYDDKHLSTQSLKKAHDEHSKSVELIKKTLEKHKSDFSIEHRHEVSDFTGYDLVITVGGDGTFLRSSHYIDEQPIIGINSSRNHSVGALCSIHAKDFPEKFSKILAGDFHCKLLPRMKIHINDEPVRDEAINDVLFTNHNPAATSRYFIRLGRKMEEHKSSGVWISTQTGSTAAIQAAGGMRMAPHFDKHLQYLVREPYQGLYNPYQFSRGFIEPGKSLKIVSKMLHSQIFIDGPTTFYNLNYGDEVAFSLSKRRLKVIV